jgi:NAD(P)-dependent dehydrogenase (short-subunit alcohol dehydrogenase family)
MLTCRFDFSGKVVIVTGGGSGIGRATALAFASSGATVVVADIDDKRSIETIHQLQEQGGESIFVKTDVSISDDVINMVKKAVAEYGRIDYAINNAGILGPLQSLTDQTEEDFEVIMNVNVKSIWLCMKYEILAMLKQSDTRSCAVVNMSSVAGIRGLSIAHIYSTSKHAIIGLTKSAALEYAKSGIRINAIAPGIIDTPGLEQVRASNPYLFDQILARHPIRRMGASVEVANAVLWLCSDAASYMTGQLLILDGGYTVQ